jgi:hypothetical protein
MKFLKQSTAAVIPMGPFLDKTDGITLKADGTTITDIDHATTGIFLIKNGGTGAIRHQNVTASVADAYGMMLVTLDTTDTNTLGRLRVCFAKAATYLPVWEDFQVLPGPMFDSLVTGSGGAIPGAVAGAAGGLFVAGTNAATTITTALTTTFTGNLTGSVASCAAATVADKTGFSLSSTGADLILKSSTFIQAIVAAINEFATYGLTAINTLLVTTGIKAATIPNATVGGYAANQDPATLLLVTPANKIATDASNCVKVPDAQKVDVNTIRTKGVTVDGGGTTFPALGSSQASVTSLGVSVAAISADGVSIAVGGIADDSFSANSLTAAAIATDAGQEIADAYLDRANAIETGITPRQAHRIEVAGAAGVVSGADTTTVLVKNPAGAKTRVTATVDADGNRSAITLTDLT